MSDKQLKPLLFGRVSRIVFGVATLVLLDTLGMDSLGPIGFVALLFLGVSFLVGGAMGNPGCEITAIPNLFRSKEKQMHSL